MLLLLSSRKGVLVSLSRAMERSPFWGNVESEFSSKEKESSLSSLLRVVSVVVSQKTVAAFDTKKNKEEREREQSGFYRERALITSPPLSCFCKSASFCFREE